MFQTPETAEKFNTKGYRGWEFRIVEYVPKSMGGICAEINRTEQMNAKRS